MKKQHLVSILILLEVILEEVKELEISFPYYGFNPYFTGSNSGRIGYQIMTRRL